MPDEATFLLARRAAEELRLGREDHVDFLSISLSQTDAIGHNWGPLSLEQLDNLLRLDRALGEFMSWLDEFVGRDRWGRWGRQALRTGIRRRLIADLGRVQSCG